MQRGRKAHKPDLYRDVNDDTSDKLKALSLKPEQEMCCFPQIFENCTLKNGGKYCGQVYEELRSKLLTMFNCGITVYDSNGTQSEYELIAMEIRDSTGEQDVVPVDRKGRLKAKTMHHFTTQGTYHFVFASQDEILPEDITKVEAIWDKELIVTLKTENFQFATEEHKQSESKDDYDSEPYSPPHAKKNKQPRKSKTIRRKQDCSTITADLQFYISLGDV